MNPKHATILREALANEASPDMRDADVSSSSSLSVGGNPVLKILDFPESRQATTFTCGAASVQAVLYYYGIEQREDQLRRELGITPDGLGVEPDAIAAFLKRQGLVTKSATMSTTDLRELIDHDVPIIICMQAWNEAYKKREVDYSGYKDGHYIVAIGYTEDSIIFDDPSIMSNRAYLSDEELDARWHDEDGDGERFDHFGMAVIGKSVFNSGDVLRIR